MSKRTLTIIASIGILISLFLGCKQDMIETLGKVQAEVEISVELPDIFPLNNPTFMLSGVHSNGTDTFNNIEFNKIKNAILLTLVPGKWTFTLDAVDSDGKSAVGISEKTIDPGQRTNIAINMVYAYYGDNSQLSVDKNTGDILLSGEIDIADDTTITLPMGKKLIIADDITVKNHTLTVASNTQMMEGVTIGGNVKITGNLSLVGEVAVSGALDLGDNELEDIDFGNGGSIVLIDDSADLLQNNTPKWYTLDGAKARYFKEDNKVQLQFIIGNGNNKITPNGKNKRPTEEITRIGAGVEFSFNSDSHEKLNLKGREIIIEDNGIYKQWKFWWDPLDTDLQSKITIMPLGEFYFGDNLSVGPKSKDIASIDWNSWKWVQDGTITIIEDFPLSDAGGKNGTYRTEKHSGNNTIQISFGNDLAVNTPIKIGDGVVATIPVNLSINMNGSTADFTNHGTLDIEGELKINNTRILKNLGIINVKDGGDLILAAEAKTCGDEPFVEQGGSIEGLWNQNGCE